MRKLFIIGLLSFTALDAAAGVIYLPAFREYTQGAYSPNEQNVALLKTMKSDLKSFRIVNISSSSPSDNYHMCRGSFPIYSPGKKPYEFVVADALARELNAAEIYADTDGVPIDVHLDTFDFSSFGSGKWTIEATFSVPGEEPLKISHSTSFSLGFGAVQSCNAANAAQSLALQEFLMALYTNQRFKELGKATSVTSSGKQSDAASSASTKDQ